MVEVVEHEPRDSHRAQVHRRRRLRNVGEPCVFGVEGQRDERLEAARLVLKLAQPEQMVGAMKRVFDVAVEHRGVASQAERVGRAVDCEPLLRVGLVLADLVANLRMEDLGTAAGQAA